LVEVSLSPSAGQAEGPRRCSPAEGRDRLIPDGRRWGGADCSEHATVPGARPLRDRHSRAAQPAAPQQPQAPESRSKPITRATWRRAH